MNLVDILCEPEREATSPAITLTEDQQNAMDAFLDFYNDPLEKVFVISGASGRGKSTLVKHLIEQLHKQTRISNAIGINVEYTPVFTATTNKAAEVLGDLTQKEATTIHSFLGLSYDPIRGTLKRSPRFYKREKDGFLIIVDEASYVDPKLLKDILDGLGKSKLVFIGDSEQLLAVNCPTSPVFNAGFNEAKLNEPVRQAKGSPVYELVELFHDAVLTGQWGQFTPDGQGVIHMSDKEFEAEIVKEFTRPDWHFKDSKILTWTNKSAMAYNDFVMSIVNGVPDFRSGDYGICNEHFHGKLGAIRAEQQVLMSKVSRHIFIVDPDTPVDGWMVRVSGYDYFLPEDRTQKSRLINKAREAGDFDMLETINSTWIDLRPAYAQTINKAQGSTYGKVFLDLTDISKNRNADTLARLLYVGAGRARTNIYLRGDLV